jgi:hypothetical protein
MNVNRKLIAAVTVFSTMTVIAAPARAQHGGGHGGGHSGSGHATGAVHGGATHGAVAGHAVPRVGSGPHVSGPTHVIGGHDYPFGHGAFGLGGHYRVPFSDGYGYAYGYGAYPYGYQPYGYGYSSASTRYGSVRIQGAPRDAAVYADGYYVGIVDDFDGALQHLNLDAGPHQIEIRAPGFPPIVFDVNVQSGRTITYRADRAAGQP